MPGIYRTLADRHSTEGAGLVGRLTSAEVDVIRSTLRRRFWREGPWSPEDGALLLLGGAIAMREDGARAGWDTIADWLGIDRPGPGPAQRARDAMSQAEALYGRRLSRGIDGRCLYIGTMFRDSGQLWRLLLRTLERLGNAEACWGPRRAWTEEDWATDLRPDLDAYDAEVRSTLAERLVELCEGRGLLVDLQLVHSTFEDTWAGVESAGVDLRELLGVHYEEEARVLLPRLFRFRTDREENRAIDTSSDIARWGVVRHSADGLAVAVRLAETLPAQGIASDDSEVRLSDPLRPRWNDLGERADIVATYCRKGDGWTLAGASTWIVVSTQGLRIAARRSERPFPLPDFPRWGLLVCETGEGDILPALATPRLGDACVLVTAPGTEVEGLAVSSDCLEGGWVSRRFRPTATLSYTVTSEGLSVTVACGRAPVPCPLQIDGRALDDARASGGPGRLRIGGRTVFVGMPRIAARSAAVRRFEPIVRRAGSDGDLTVAARWHRGTLQLDSAGPGAWTVEEPGGRWRARFHVLATDQLPSAVWTTAGVKLALPEEAGWTCGNRSARGTAFYPPLPTDGPGPTIVTAAIPGKPEYQWSFAGRAAEIALLDAAGGVRDSLTIARSELARGDVLRLRGPAGARVEVRVNGEPVAERILPLGGELMERSGLLFRQVGTDAGDLDVLVSVLGAEAARTFTLFDDGPIVRPVGTPRNLELTQDEEGGRRLRLDADVTLERPRLGIVRLGAELPWIGWEDCQWRNEYRSAPLALPPGGYAVVLRGDRRLPNGGEVPDAQTHAARFVVPGQRAIASSTALAQRLKAQSQLDLSASRRRLDEVASDLRQLANLGRCLDGAARAELVRDIVALPAAAPRLAWWVLRARAGIDTDASIDEAVLSTLESLLMDAGWHPSWIRYTALVQLLPVWPRGGYAEWQAAAQRVAAKIITVHPGLRVPLDSLLNPVVIVHMVANQGYWPPHFPVGEPRVPMGRVVLPEIPSSWERQARAKLVQLEKSKALAKPISFVIGSRLEGTDGFVARAVVLRAYALVSTRAEPTREGRGDQWGLDDLLELASWTQHVEENADLARRARLWELALLQHQPLTTVGK